MSAHLHCVCVDDLGPHVLRNVHGQVRLARPRAAQHNNGKARHKPQCCEMASIDCEKQQIMWWSSNTDAESETYGELSHCGSQR